MPAGRRLPHRRPRVGIPAGAPRRRPRARLPGRRRRSAPSSRRPPPWAWARSAPACCPARHGLVGAAFEYPETDELLSPLALGRASAPRRRAARADRVRGGRPAARTDDDGVAGCLPRLRADAGRAARRATTRRPTTSTSGSTPSGACSTRGEPSFTYVYWPELDRIGHEFGVDSREWRAALSAGRRPRRAARRRARPGRARWSSPPTTAWSTARPGLRVDIEADPLLMAGVRQVAGEPRARHLYVGAGCRRATCRPPGGRCWAIVPSSCDARSWSTRGYFGDVDPELEARIGDVMAVPPRQRHAGEPRRHHRVPAHRPARRPHRRRGAASPHSSDAAHDVWHDVRVSELIFYAGTMDCGKSTLALQTDHNHSSRGRSGVVFTRLDRAGDSVLSSRLGLEVPAVEVDDDPGPAGLRRRSALQRRAHRLPDLRRGPVLQRGAGRPARRDRGRARRRRLRLRDHDRLPHPPVPGVGPPGRARRPRAGAAGRGPVLVRCPGHPQRAHRERRDGRRGQPGDGGRHHDRADRRTSPTRCCAARTTGRTRRPRGPSASTCRRSRCRSGRD